MVVPGELVTLAYVHPNDVSINFHHSLSDLKLHDVARGQHLCHQWGELPCRFGDSISSARNLAVEGFLQGKAEWLLWVDSDMGFPPDSLEVLMASVDKDTRPIVGGLCFVAQEKSSDGMNGQRIVPKPTIYHYVEPGQFHPVAAYPTNRLVQCAATGSAFILIHRRVFETLESDWYNRIPNPNGKLMGEDVSFCVRAQAAGFPVWVNTGCKTTHQKTWWVSDSDFWNTYQAPPADEPVAVVVPVMKRPASAEPFMRSLRASTGLATVYAVCDPGDSETYTAWLEAGAEVLVSDRGHTFAQKANYALGKTSEDWLLLVGDDVKFHPGWWDHALDAARRDNASVVATNDLGNARVMAGVHATHPVISRRYIEEQGASWDGPGSVCHEGYRHWYVDNEWTRVAQEHGVFTAALGSKIEHLHPIWGKGEVDDTYRKGEHSQQRDAALWERRSRLLGGKQ